MVLFSLASALQQSGDDDDPETSEVPWRAQNWYMPSTCIFLWRLLTPDPLPALSFEAEAAGRGAE